ncbi:MAG TPA: hypothetical protein VFV70_09100, partial [Hyphomonadaceae bacterium]|nr:hypothetical protein [Hyphomonadaceae bacterium]
MRFLIIASAVAASGCATSTQQACDRSCRLGMAEAFVRAGDFPAEARVTENGAVVSGATWLKG